MFKCSKCQNDFIPLLKSNRLPYKTCDRCKCTDKKYRDTHKEHIKLYRAYPADRVLQVRRSVQAVCFCDRFFTLNHLCVYHIGGVSKHLCVYLRSYVCVFGEFVCMYVHVCVFCHDLLHIFVHRRLHLTILVIPVESDRRRRIHSYSIAVNSRRCIQHDVTCACVCGRATNPSASSISFPTRWRPIEQGPPQECPAVAMMSNPGCAYSVAKRLPSPTRGSVHRGIGDPHAHARLRFKSY
jgi:hypothetical protein